MRSHCLLARALGELKLRSSAQEVLLDLVVRNGKQKLIRDLWAGNGGMGGWDVLVCRSAQAIDMKKVV
jgi:hypothetical protein